MKIPTILCGPIIRRVEPNQVCIWIALSKPLKVGAKIYTVERNSSSDSYTYQEIRTKSNVETVQLGENLYISLLKLNPSQDSLPTDTLLAYNLFFKKGTNVVGLGAFNLLSPDNPDSIVYGDLDLPTFYISSGQHSNILYGSCRKPHGKGDDVLVQADKKLEDSYFNLERRPTSLFLMGDQIYADDIADPLLPFISKLGEALIGQREQLEEIDPRLTPYSHRLDKVQGRKFIMNQLCNFTSKHSHNHLMQLGEYAAMYLLNWSPELWKLLYEHPFDSFEEAVENNNIHFVFPEDSDNRIKEKAKVEAQYNEHVEALVEFQQHISSIRRLLANTPTYMIFDDHDITDDWNITADWKNAVWNAPLGRHIISNGMAAYWAFQGWGNDPELFSNQFIKAIASYCKSMNVKSNNYREFTEALWYFNDWHFVAPTVPKAVFLDTRTMRGYLPLPKPKKIGTKFLESVQGPELITEKGFQRVSEVLQEGGWTPNTPLIIVSPSPLYGIDIIESFLLDYLSPLRLVGFDATSTFDLEAWKFNGKGITNFLHAIADWNPSQCFILSGDVHYGFMLDTKIEFNNKKETKIHQLTSSPIKNMSFSGVLGPLIKGVVGITSFTRKKKTIHRFCSQDFSIADETNSTPCPSSFMWKETVQYVPTSSGSFIETTNNLGLLSFTLDTYENELLNENSSLDES
ncbi:hypothetical protein IMZ08_07085 [Bacillus luteolus]|uniref:PhoD-like phosphatase metallophosphatase domain-containing protein n=1 Tax=Litchfieldia luteola TaxID=682179 RepID=A0ABR9QHB4_9BACI|nr:hypothetical protein [Cytobacillus luteolus]MBE4907816.1 hypothetical protein [Cytobacillus luteolus]MBP1944027.1 hypothetical protein [Cytobacillus luteolus]